jgi:manganese/zinc/iron transport system permease protein
MMALTAGLLFLIASLVAPRNGVIARVLRSQTLSLRILSEDLIALMYRMDERQPGSSQSWTELRRILGCGRLSCVALMFRHFLRGRITRSADGYRLTDKGRRLGTELVRSHRLWEQYLVTEAGVSVDRIHGQAEKLEHFTGRELRDRLEKQTSTPDTDPHGRPIPSE